MKLNVTNKLDVNSDYMFSNTDRRNGDTENNKAGQ